MVDAVVTEVHTAIKWFMGIVMAVMGYFLKGALEDSKETRSQLATIKEESEKKIHATQLDIAEVKVALARDYQTKAASAEARREYREELKRVHDRIDTLPKEIADLIRGHHV